MCVLLCFGYKFFHILICKRPVLFKGFPPSIITRLILIFLLKFVEYAHCLIRQKKSTHVTRLADFSPHQILGGLYY